MKADSLLQKVDLGTKLGVSMVEEDSQGHDPFTHAVLLQAQMATTRDRARRVLLTEMDFKRLGSHHFRSWDSSQNCHDNADAAFTQFVSNPDIQLTEDEESIFRQNFDDHVEAGCKASDDASIALDWTSAITEAFEDERCVFTSADADATNVATSSYHVTAQGCISVREMQTTGFAGATGGVESA